jgi:hypothetical protein
MEEKSTHSDIPTIKFMAATIKKKKMSRMSLSTQVNA